MFQIKQESLNKCFITLTALSRLHCLSLYVNTTTACNCAFLLLGCGKSNYAGLSGIITSPNYLNPYTKMDPACDYYVYPVSSVVLSFQSFDLGPFIDTKNGDNVKVWYFLSW